MSSKIRTLLWISLLATKSHFAFAVTPSIDDWIEELPDDISHRDVGIPRSVGIVSNGGSIGFQPLAGYEASEINKLSFLRVASAKQFEWGLKINRRLFPQIKDAVLIQRMLGVNALLVDDPAGDYILIPSTGEKTKLKIKLRDHLGNPKDFVKSLFSGLGYEGIVLSKKGPYLLVGESYAGVFSKTSNGTLLEPPEFPGEPKKKMGVISYIESKGGYALFEILYLTQETFQVPIGTHVVSDGPSSEE